MESKSVKIQTYIDEIVEDKDQLASGKAFDDPIQRRNFLNLKPSPFSLSILCSLIAGMVWALSMPGYGLSFIAWVGLIPLLLFIKEQKTLSKTSALSFTFAMGFNITSLRWLLGLHPLMWMGIDFSQSTFMAFSSWIGVSVYSSVFFTVFGICTHYILKSKFQGVYKYLMVACLWSFIMNKLLSVGMFAFPWANIEYSQYENTMLIQIVKVIKGIGLGFVIVWVNTYLAFSAIKVYKRIKKVRLKFKPLIPVVNIFLFFALFGLMMLNKQHNLPDTNVTVIQSNTTIEDDRLQYYSLDNMKNYYKSVIKLSPKGIVVLPECAYLEYLRLNDKEYFKSLKELAYSEEKTLVLGMMDANKINGKAYPTNSAVVIDKNIKDDNDGIYDKQHLVPFGEYVPFYNLMGEDLKRVALNFVGINFKKGNKVKVFDTKNGKIAPNICYDLIFSNLTKKQVLQGAQILVNMSNLSWFHHTIIKDQFIAFGTFRAIETGRPVIAAINTGSSFIISDKGQLMLKLEPQTAKIKTINLKDFYNDK